MELNKGKNITLAELDNGFWVSEEHYLVKTDIADIEYSIYLINPPRMSLLDDVEFAKLLIKKMLEYGVRVFESNEEFLEFEKNNRLQKPAVAGSSNFEQRTA